MVQNLLIIAAFILLVWLTRLYYLRKTKLTPREAVERDEQVRDLIRHSYHIREQITLAETMAEVEECKREILDLLDTFAGICAPETLDRHRVRLQDALDDKDVRIRARNF